MKLPKKGPRINPSQVKKQIEKLEYQIQTEVIGFEKEKRSFSAHLTLGRVKSPKGRNSLVEKIKALEFQSSAEMEINELVLFKSTLTPKGSIYTPLHQSKFSEA